MASRISRAVSRRSKNHESKERMTKLYATEIEADVHDIDDDAGTSLLAMHVDQLIVSLACFLCIYFFLFPSHTHCHSLGCCRSAGDISPNQPWHTSLVRAPSLKAIKKTRLYSSSVEAEFDQDAECDQDTELGEHAGANAAFQPTHRNLLMFVAFVPPVTDELLLTRGDFSHPRYCHFCFLLVYWLVLLWSDANFSETPSPYSSLKRGTWTSGPGASLFAFLLPGHVTSRTYLPRSHIIEAFLLHLFIGQENRHLRISVLYGARTAEVVCHLSTALNQSHLFISTF